MTIKLTENDQVIMDEITEAMDVELLQEAQLAESQGRRANKKDVHKRVVARTAILLAKASSDPLYPKYKDSILKVKELRSILMTRYSSQAKSMIQKKQ